MSTTGTNPAAAPASASAADRRPTVLEFFAGGGMARLGLGPGWRTVFANEWDARKAASYAAFHGSDPPVAVEDVARLSVDDLPRGATLAWASFPCQDLSLAGARSGLAGARSGTFVPFWELMRGLRARGDAPPLVVLENVPGAVTSNGGEDFRALIAALVLGGYRVAPFIIDAARFVPQSRPRLFLAAIDLALDVPDELVDVEPSDLWHRASLRAAVEALPFDLRRRCLWIHPPAPPRRDTPLEALIEDEPVGTAWHAPEETARLVSLMGPVHLAKLEQARRLGRRIVGTVYKRTRPRPDGTKGQTAEVRFDGVAGCLRTPSGGSSRETILVVDGDRVRSRLLSPREAARLMGLPDSYPLPDAYNEAYHLAGDGVVVPCVRHLATYVLEPLLRRRR
jgi:DNA (cytosine-5)-methyltransferase 1